MTDKETIYKCLNYKKKMSKVIFFLLCIVMIERRKDSILKEKQFGERKNTLESQLPKILLTQMKSN